MLFTEQRIVLLSFPHCQHCFLENLNYSMARRVKFPLVSLSCGYLARLLVLMLHIASHSASRADIFSQVSNHFLGVGFRSETIKLGCWSIWMFLIHFVKLLSSVWECKFLNYLTWDSQMKRIKIMLPILYKSFLTKKRRTSLCFSLHIFYS